MYGIWIRIIFRVNTIFLYDTFLLYGYDSKKCLFHIKCLVKKSRLIIKDEIPSSCWEGACGR